MWWKLCIQYCGALRYKWLNLELFRIHGLCSIFFLWLTNSHFRHTVTLTHFTTSSNSTDWMREQFFQKSCGSLLPSLILILTHIGKHHKEMGWQIASIVSFPKPSSCSHLYTNSGASHVARQYYIMLYCLSVTMLVSLFPVEMNGNAISFSPPTSIF